MTTTELKGISHELKFWQGFVKTPRFIDGWVANIKTPELRQEVFDFIESVKHDLILDVGSGAVSILNGSFPNVTAVDPLGEMYELIFDYKKYGINPPLPIPAEELSFNGMYDIVHISNALDHSQDPKIAFAKLLSCVKKGGYLIVQGFENEGTFENWEGFHKWNIEASYGSLTLTDKSGDASLLDVNANRTMSFQFESKTWYVWITKK